MAALFTFAARITWVMAFAALFLGWDAPNHYPPWVTFHLEAASAIGIGLLFLFLWLRQHAAAVASPDGMGRSLVTLPTSARIWLLLALLPAAQYGAGLLSFRGDALIGGLYAAGCAMAIYVGHWWAASSGGKAPLQAMAKLLVAAGLFAGAVGLGQWLRLDVPGWWAMELIDDRPFANFGQPNQFGLLMLWALLATAALFEWRLIVHRWVAALAAAYFGLGIAISGSRSALLGLVLVALFWLCLQRARPSRIGMAAIAIGIAAALSAHVAVNALQQVLMTNVTEVRAVLEAGARPAIWRHFIAAIAEQPWLGYGFNQGVAALAAVADRVEPSRNVTFAHNVLLDMATWFGVPIGLCLTLAFAGWMWSWLARGARTLLLWERGWVFALWLALVTQSLLEFPFAHAYFLLPACLVAGAVAAPRAAFVGGPSARAPWAVTAAAAAIAAVFAWTVIEYFQIEDEFRDNRFAKAKFVHSPAPAASVRPLLLDQLGALNASALIQVRAGMPQSDIDALHRLARRYHILWTHWDLACALALNGQRPAADAEWRILRSTYHPSVYAALRRQWRAWLQLQHLPLDGDG